MKALVYYGPHELRLEDRPDVALGSGQVRTGVNACGICGSDLHAVLKATPRRTPGIVMGHEIAGTLIEIGSDVKGWRVGDRVAIQPLTRCGTCPLCRSGHSNVCEKRTLYGMTPGMPGGYAERVVVTEDRLHRIADGVPFEMATLGEPLGVGLHAVGRGPAEPARTLAIIGCGTIGLMTLAALSTRQFDAVFVLDKIESKLELARALGARTLLVGRDDIAAIREATDGRGVDWAIEAVGVSETASLAVELTRTGGHVTWIGNAQPLAEIRMQSVVVGERTIAGSYGYTDEEFRAALDLVAAGRVPGHWLAPRRVTLESAAADFDALASGQWACVKAVMTP
jgi:L-iditol 2-dehydrogenase